VLLFLYCRLQRHLPSIAVLAQDHLNDVMFNSTGLVLSYLATNYYNWIDPIGAMLIATLIIRSWGSTALKNIKYIVGITADPAFLNRLTYLSLTHDSRILKIDTARAYHSGNSLCVEVDIVLPPEMPLAEAHDIGESLQMKLETLKRVDRAFVHLDYEVEHKPEHKSSQARQRRSTKETV
jgi:divalent metal cation (Fe/Co/Zn/Cd) transporter